MGAPRRRSTTRVTPRSREQSIPYYEAKGHTVLAPAYPGFEVGVEALRADPRRGAYQPAGVFSRVRGDGPALRPQVAVGEQRDPALAASMRDLAAHAGKRNVADALIWH